jgi:asparagine synthase (glutamine-hydrolysing)
MCGMSGIITRRGRPVAEADLWPILAAQEHRGPDDWDVWSDGACALGHRRLSIIDLSAAGRQPLANEDGTVWITFNGEIYNFQALRAELEGLGHRFRTRTDTEAVVHAYEQWSTDCVRRLRGMFAFGLWDQKRRRLLLARDRAGKKPLFYTEAGGRFLFASELQGLLADAAVPREINLPALDDYLAFGYIPAPQTAFRGIRKLPPAHTLTLDLTPAGVVTRLERYWTLAYEPKLRLAAEEAAAALREKLTEAVRLRMTSDVPLGAFLSGGIDSSIVTGLMAQTSGARVKTFSIGFAEAAYNELEHARRVAARWETDHHEFIVQPDALAVLPRLARHFGEPFADSSAVPSFYVAQMTRASVTVALTGDGGDESFAGYERYLANRIAERARRLPGFAAAARRLSRALPATAGPKSQWRRAQRFLAVASRPMAERYAAWAGASTGCFSQEARRQLYGGEMRALLAQRDAGEWMTALFAGTRHLDPVEAAMAVDVRSYLPYDLLVKVDITTMAHSLEARSPLLDHEVMELAARLPVGLKLRGRESKYLLKRACADLLPAENARRRKMGFGVPVGEWFRHSLRPLLQDALLSEQALRRGYFLPEALRRLVTEHLERRADHGFALWSLLMLELWHRELADSSPAPARTPREYRGARERTIAVSEAL